MEIILSKQCESLTGSLGRGFGYSIQKRTGRDGKTRFWGVRNSKGPIPHGGHLRFIFTCAELAKSKLHIADISISSKEFRQACEDADRWYGTEVVIAKATCLYNANDVLRFKQKWNL